MGGIYSGVGGLCISRSVKRRLSRVALIVSPCYGAHMTLYEDAAEPRLTIDLDALAAGIEDRHVAMSYAQSSGWNSYRQILRNSFGVAVLSEPHESWLEWRGHTLHIDTHDPVGEPRGTIILVHGAGGHGRLLAPIGEFLAGLGWRAIAPDLPGYGLTRVRDGWLEDYSEWPECVADLAKHCEGPVVLFGLSLGGMTALRGAQLFPDVRGVIATTLIDMSDPGTFASAARWRWLGHLTLAFAKVFPALLDRLPFRLRWVTPLSAMTSDTDLQRWFLEDPLIGGRRVRGRFFRTLHAYQPPRSDYSLTCPLLLAHPGRDVWTPLSMSMTVFDATPSPKHLRVLTNGSHLPAETPAWMELCDAVRDFLEPITLHPISPSTEVG